MEVFLSFISLILLSAGLGIDNGLLIEFSLKSLKLEPRRHLVWRSVALVCAALLRIGFLFSLSKLTFLAERLPDYAWLPNRWFSENPQDLTWMHLVLTYNGSIEMFRDGVSQASGGGNNSGWQVLRIGVNRGQNNFDRICLP